MPTGSELSALERLLRPLSRTMAKDLARALVDMEADEDTQARYEELADRRTEGKLSEKENMELESIVRANTLLGILKVEARHILAQSS